MTDIDRRLLIGGLAVAGATLASTQARSQTKVLEMKDIKKEAEISCLYHCDFGDPGRVRQMITNINNHLAAYDYDAFKIKILVVTHAQGIKPFIDNFEGTPWSKDAPAPDLLERYEGMAKFGVDVLLCRTSFASNKIDISKARSAPFIKQVPSGVAALGDLQAKGFGYIKIG